MMPGTPDISRGCVFRAEHDSSYEFWNSDEPRWKRCLAFNLVPPSASDDVHYFITTSKLTYFHENPHLLSDILILPANEYRFFPEETAIDFRDLRVVPLAKLQSKGLSILGQITPADVARCEAVIRTARLLENRAKRLLGVLN